MVSSKRPINLIRGWPSPSLLPASLLAAAAQRVLSDPSVYTPALQYGPDPGYQPLRENMAEWLGRHYGVEPDPERICITGGASQNLACVLQSFSDPVATKAVWMIAPCYHLAYAIFEDSGFKGRLRAVPEDDEGIDLEVLESKIQALEEEEKKKHTEPKPFKDPGSVKKLYRHIIYVVATCANPSGKTMSVRRREGLVKLARKYDALVISDDVYDFLQWPLDGLPVPERTPDMKLPRLCDIDLAMGQADSDPGGFGYAISNGSFSKIAGPGVRTGWVEASPAFALGLSQTGSTKSGGAPSQFCAAMMSELVRTGSLERFVETTTRPALKRRHRLMMDAIAEHLVAPAGVQLRGSSLRGAGVYGGYFVWLTLGDGAPPSKMVADAALREENLVVGHGNMFEVRGDEASARFDREVRLCFSWEPEEDVVEGVRRLGGLLGRMQENKGYYEAMAAKARSDGGGDTAAYK